jgi:hypothetical protein
MIKSTYDSNDEVIKAIMELYEIPQFDLDCTYSKRYVLEKHNTAKTQNRSSTTV